MKTKRGIALFSGPLTLHIDEENVSSVVDGAGFEPAASAMPTLRSFQADLPAHDILNLTRKLLSVMGKKRIQHFRILTLFMFQVWEQTET